MIRWHWYVPFTGGRTMPEFTTISRQEAMLQTSSGRQKRYLDEYIDYIRACLRFMEGVRLRLLPGEGNHVSFLSQRYQSGAICPGAAHSGVGTPPDQAPHGGFVRCFLWRAVCLEKRLSVARAAKRLSQLA